MQTIMTVSSSPEIHIAPMLHYSTQEFLHFMRILTKRAILWTEMVVEDTIIFNKNNLNQFLGSRADVSNLSPIVCQIGGRHPEWIGECTKIVEDHGYSGINLNVDCPSVRVSGKGQFGAILMHQKHISSEVVKAMNSNSKRIPISVKTRTGIELSIDEIYDTFDHLIGYIERLRQNGCHKFIIHARKCVIGGLSPAQNRLVPPLNYPRVYDLCREFPDCEFIINGGIPGLKAAKELHQGLEKSRSEDKHTIPCYQCGASNGSCVHPPTFPGIPNMKGAMLGRACIDNPAMFWDVDRYIFGDLTNPCQNRRQLLEKYCAFLERRYPRRCCDDFSQEKEVTTCYKVAEESIHPTNEGGCSICDFIYRPSKQKNRRSLNSLSSPFKPCDVSNEVPIKIYVCSLDRGQLRQKEKKSQPKILISSVVMDRSIKPVLGIFFGKAKAKLFRHELHCFARDLTNRNCGPGFAIRKAMLLMPAHALDEPFTKTEDLTHKDLTVHHSPQSSCQSSC